MPPRQVAAEDGALELGEKRVGRAILLAREVLEQARPFGPVLQRVRPRGGWGGTLSRAVFSTHVPWGVISFGHIRNLG
jgi:hypothetical protein